VSEFYETLWRDPVLFLSLSLPRQGASTSLNRRSCFGFFNSSERWYSWNKLVERLVINNPELTVFTVSTVLSILYTNVYVIIPFE
jgi:hypothetical protein